MRPQLHQFAEEMEKVLQQNDYKGGWIKCNYSFMVSKLSEEFTELLAEFGIVIDIDIFVSDSDVDKCEWFAIQKESLDLANICMMIHNKASMEIDRHNEKIQLWMEENKCEPCSTSLDYNR